MKKILLLVLILFVSGCVEGINLQGLMGGIEGEEALGNGVVIKSFESDFSKVYSGDEISLLLEVENVGGETAYDVAAYLEGISTDEWEVSDPFKYMASSLRGPDLSKEIPGETDQVKWDMEVPNLPKEVSVTYTPLVRVFYKYETTATSTIPVLDYDEYRRLINSDESLPTQSATQVTYGPLDVDISARNPVVITESDETFRITVTIINLVHNGNTFDPRKNIDEEADAKNLGKEDLDEVKIRITAPDVEDVPGECPAFEDWEIIELRRGQSTAYICELKAEDIVSRKNIQVTVDLDYGFLINDETTITAGGINF